MEKVKRGEQLTILAMTAEEFDDKVNQALEAAALRGAVVENIDRRIQKGFVAFIDFASEITTGVTAEDRHIDEGDIHLCGHCPYYAKPKDRRKRWVACNRGVKELTAYDSKACGWFYEALDKDAIKVVGSNA